MNDGAMVDVNVVNSVDSIAGAALETAVGPVVPNGPGELEKEKVG